MTSYISTVRSPRLIAYHLPQFHPIPENNEWWGNGFTEWTNVRKSRPLYRGHHQPSVPLDDNYYNLTYARAREAQAALAKRFGIDGFCYYHYWFKGKKLLERPCEAILESGEPDFPFCFSWANETWTRRWDGGSHDVLIRQEYGEEPDWKQPFDYLLPYFRDPRYITHEGKPVFLVYIPGYFPEVTRWVGCWQKWARANGLPGIHFVKTLTAQDHQVGDAGFSGFASFEPWLTVWRRRGRRLDQHIGLRKKLLHARKSLRLCPHTTPFVFGYEEIWERMLHRRYVPGEYRGAFVAWDNSPRMGLNAKIVAGSTPRKFGQFLGHQIAASVREKTPFLFINAWNEWAEGAYLEPDQRHGYDYLEQVQAAIESGKSLSHRPLTRPGPLARVVQLGRRSWAEPESMYHG